jgi:hypothetical protein
MRLVVKIGTSLVAPQGASIPGVCALWWTSLTFPGMNADLQQAIRHINRHSTKHSDAIVTRDEVNARRFLREIDSAAVYWNASTCFSDGNEFGFGAEMGISTQKLHCRGPFALAELTSTKYEVVGSGQAKLVLRLTTTLMSMPRRHSLRIKNGQNFSI